MRLEQIVAGLNCEIIGEKSREITGLAYDSRKVNPGDLFFCIEGFAVDGHKFAANAVEAGAVALMVTRKLDLPVSQILVEDGRLGMAEISAAFYGHPARKMNMIGLTGTNGKTSTTYMIKAICEEREHKVGLIGTIKNLIGDKEIHTERTTPESMDLQALLAQMADEGVDTVVMEVSSHSLALKRVAGIRFDVGVFTNLTQDHLDFHGDFAHYAQAKRMLCDMSNHMVINGDDAYGEYMCKSTCPDHFLYGVQTGHMQALDPEISPKGTAFTLAVDGQKIRIEVAISGIFTVYNALAAAAATYKMGYTLEEIRNGLKKMVCVPGRFEALDTRGGGYDVILDYAHTPDSLENTLKTIRGFAPGRVVCIVGCGGNRDAAKRPIMAEIAGKYADYTILTSDNPRFEEPMDILAQMEAGIKGKGYDYTIVENRREAIKLALKHAQPKEIILLAGKGHEDYQEIRGVKHPFDEKVVVSQLLDELERESAKE